MLLLLLLSRPVPLLRFVCVSDSFSRTIRIPWLLSHFSLLWPLWPWPQLQMNPSSP
ncbi:hypothetical protein ACRALDRAFT_1063105 [Sodiomyces alcalophilus JCM 7366]|uniref:uncharacterized protein n=1 Tax=Sodiomyces alcalophilus JCM 7366 TaxID=591952 RepID=UPI0039B45E41